MANADVRKYAAGRGVYLWEIADALGVSEATFSRKVRREMSDDEKTKIRQTINKIAEGRA